jgi:predicted Ser/Thr protein kinase
MVREEDRRRWPREPLAGSGVGIVYPKHKEGVEEPGFEELRGASLVRVMNRSQSGFLLESPARCNVGTLLDMRVRLPHEPMWRNCKGRVVWINESPHKQNRRLLGVELLSPEADQELSDGGISVRSNPMSPSDLDFFRRTPFFDALFMSEEARRSLLHCMTPEYVQAGERFIEQGGQGDTFYVIQEGSCAVRVEKDGTESTIAHLHSGDLVGEIALLTGGPRSAHVDAETDLKLWSITKNEFDALCEECSEVRNFLTQLLSHRLCSKTGIGRITIAKYVVDEIIGWGGWSTVFKGLHKGLNMPVAIKMLKHDMAMDSDFYERFRNEARTIAALNHENIVRVHDIEELCRTVFIVMEYLEGISLDHLLKKTPQLPLSRAISILMQVCNALTYAHGQGIVHQDVKPANIFVQPADRVKMVDFGLASHTGSEDPCMPGTPFYMSPEQIEGESIDGRTDVYALGLTAFELFTGQRAFGDKDIKNMIDAHLHEDVPNPRTLAPHLPNELGNFVVRATRRDPSARYGSILEALHDLEPLARTVTPGQALC